MIKILAVALLLTSCGPKDLDRRREPPLPPLQINSELWHFVELFKEDGLLRGVNIQANSIRFLEYESLSGTTAGTCTPYLDGNGGIFYSEIRIDEIYRLYDFPLTKKALLYHELGHCLLGLEHKEVQPPVIMNPSLLLEIYYKANWTKLVDELFNSQISILD